MRNSKLSFSVSDSILEERLAIHLSSGCPGLVPSTVRLIMWANVLFCCSLYFSVVSLCTFPRAISSINTYQQCTLHECMKGVWCRSGGAPLTAHCSLHCTTEWSVGPQVDGREDTQWCVCAFMVGCPHSTSLSHHTRYKV